MFTFTASPWAAELWALVVTHFKFQFPNKFEKPTLTVVTPLNFLNRSLPWFKKLGGPSGTWTRLFSHNNGVKSTCLDYFFSDTFLWSITMARTASIALAANIPF